MTIQTQSDGNIRTRIIVSDAGAADFWLLWLKRVRGFNAAWHCSRCLLGKMQYQILPKRRAAAGEYGGTVAMGPGRYLYLCGVTRAYARNLHIAMRYEPGGVVTWGDGRIAVRFEDAARLEIPPLATPSGRGEAYDSCRNYRFGARYLAGAGV